MQAPEAVQRDNLGMVYALFVIGVLALTALISYSTFATAMLLKRWRLPSNPLLNKADTLLRLVLIGLCIGLGLLSQLDWTTLGWTLTQPLRQILLGAAVGLVLGVGFHSLSRWVLRTRGARLYSEKFVQMIVPHSWYEFYRVALALVLVVLLEEMLFRSLLIGGFSPLLPVQWLVVIVSLLFGALHAPQGVWGMAGAALAGGVLGVLFLVEQSLLAPSIAHYVTNVVQIVLVMRLVRANPNQTAGSSSAVG